MRKGRPAAITAALLLIGVSVFGGALSASAAPSTPVITSPTNGSLSPGTPAAILGNADGLNTIQVTVTNSNGTNAPYCDATTPAGGPNTPWSGTCSGSLSPLPLGTNTFTAHAYLTANLAAGTTDSAPVSITIYDTTPADLTTAPSGNTSDSTPHFAGNGPVGGTVDVEDGAANQYCSVPVAADGTWACDLTPLPPASYAGFRARALDAGGAPTYDGNASFTVTAPNSPTVDQTYNPWTTSNSQPAILGGKDPDVTRVVVNDGAKVFCDISGLSATATTWSCPSPNGSPLTLGSNTLTAVGFNSHGDSSGAPAGSTLITLVSPPTIDSPVDNLVTNQTTLTFSGTTPTGVDVGVHYDGEEGPFCHAEVTGTDWACTASGLLDGSYNYYAAVTGQDVVSDYHTLTIDTIAPEAPTLDGPAGTTTDRTPTFFGSGEPGARVTLLVNGSAVPCASGTGTVDGSGLWECTTANSLDIDSYSVQAFQQDAATNVSALSNTALLTIALPPVTPTPTATPTPKPRMPLVWTFSTGGKTEFLPGDEVDITSSGLPAGSTVDAVLHSTPVTLGSTTVKPDGSFSMHVIIPADTPPGAHHFVVTVTPVDGDASVVEVPATVKPAPKQAASGPKKTQTKPVTAPGATGFKRDDPGAPSSLTHSLKSIFDIISNPVAIAIAAAAGLVFLLFVAFPAELLNSTLEAQYERLAKRIPRVRAQWWNRFTEWLDRRPLVGAGVMIAIAAVIFSFADPGFGFDITSLRLILACAIALFVVGYLASVIAGLILGRRLHLDTRMEIKPLGLILTVVGVVVSRLIDFTPGFLIGLLLGLALIGRAKSADRAKSTLVQSGVVFALAMLAWAGYGILSAGAEPGTFASSLLTDTLVAITTEGLTGLFVGLLPFRFLDGQEIYQFSRPLWVASYAVAAVAFVAVVVPFANNWLNEGSSFWLWVGIVAAFTVLSVGVYVFFRRRDGREDEEDAEKEQDAEKVDAVR